MELEQHLTARHPELVGGALTVNIPGRRQTTTALLIEPATPPSSTGSGPGPTTTTAEQASLIEKIWPSIAEANTTAVLPAHARIDKALILVLTPPPNRPLLRDSNGAIQRAANAQRYADELAALWANADFGPVGDGGASSSSSSAVPPSDRDSIAQFVQESVSAVTSWPHEDQARHHQQQPGAATFFERGMDSLVALQLARVLRRGLRCPGVGLSTVYCNPTVSQLTSAVFAAVEEEESGGPVGT